MGVQVIRWRADDGSLFETQRDLLLYEMQAIDRREIELFLDKYMRTSSSRRSEYRRVLNAWQQHMREGTLDE